MLLRGGSWDGNAGDESRLELSLGALLNLVIWLVYLLAKLWILVSLQSVMALRMGRTPDFDLQLLAPCEANQARLPSRLNNTQTLSGPFVIAVPTVSHHYPHPLLSVTPCQSPTCTVWSLWQRRAQTHPWQPRHGLIGYPLSKPGQQWTALSQHCKIIAGILIRWQRLPE